MGNNSRLALMSLLHVQSSSFSLPLNEQQPKG
jgi:hypothetical protein